MNAQKPFKNSQFLLAFLGVNLIPIRSATCEGCKSDLYVSLLRMSNATRWRHSLCVFLERTSPLFTDWNVSCTNDVSAQNALQCVMVHVVDGIGSCNATCHGNCSVFSLWNVLQCVKKCRFQLNLGRIINRCYCPRSCLQLLGRLTQKNS